MDARGKRCLAGFVILLVYLVVFSAISVVFIYKKKNL